MIKRFIKKCLFELGKSRYKNVRFLQGSFCANCAFEGHNSIGEDSVLKDCGFGQGSYTGSKVQLSNVRVGRFCSIGSFVRNTTGRHPSSVFVSTHPAFFSVGKAAGFTFSATQRFQELKYAAGEFLVTVGNDVWIGDNVTIVDGVRIGDGAIIGANSLVTKDVAPYTVNVGTPAVAIRNRFEEPQIEALLHLEWWNRDFEWVKRHHEYFDDIESFLEEMKMESTTQPGI
ncbi:MAG: CatB-related O-acetyltransferase [Sphingobacteriales bacterium]|nr:MAG: CatB-related O-acetyltransferase [Sphingobacteriales bacterium]